VGVVAYDEEGRPYLGRSAAALMALIAAVIGATAVVLWNVSTSANADTGSKKTAPGRPASVATCLDAVARGDAAVKQASELEAVLATQTRVMNDLLAHRLTTEQALAAAVPSLTRGSQQALQFDQDASAYGAAASRCRRG
jgi:hypothetical protein